ncbi:MAG: hypothetical protein ABWY04_12860 [Arthrobacter sp.]
MHLSIVQDAGLIDLFDTLHAVGEILTASGRPDAQRRQWEDRGSKAHQFLEIALEPSPAAHSPGSASSGSAPDQLPGHAVPAAFLHEQVSERKFRTGRNRSPI